MIISGKVISLNNWPNIWIKKRWTCPKAFTGILCSKLRSNVQIFPIHVGIGIFPGMFTSTNCGGYE